MFRYTLDSTNKLYKIRNYITQYNLIGQKSIIFNKWVNALKIIETKNHF
jgi:hypothetical protein